jgi:hypothetical protein
MPWKPAGPCGWRGWPPCPERATRRGFCEKHVHDSYKQDAQVRGSAFERGYDGSWKVAREKALRAAGIPHHLWKFYQVHHSIAYPSLGKDHSLYKLRPLPTGEHSSETDAHGGGYGNPRKDDVHQVRRVPPVVHHHVCDGDDGPIIG